MNLPAKPHWVATASGGDPRLAIDGQYSTAWQSEPVARPWFAIDLGQPARLGGLEVYWGRCHADAYRFEHSADGEDWQPLCQTRYGEGGQNVFAFPETVARQVRWVLDQPEPGQAPEIVEINLYAPEDALTVREDGRIAALGAGPVRLPVGESITLDFGYVRPPLGVLVDWGEPHGTDFSAHLSDDGETFREMGRITSSDGGSDSFWWRSTTARYLRLTLPAASDPEGAVINELKPRVLNKDRMPIGHLERAAQAARPGLYPQSLLSRQVYWTVLGEMGSAEEALFDEYGNLEPRQGAGQLMPFLRVGGQLAGAADAASCRQSLAEGSLPLPAMAWQAGDIELEVRALARNGVALLEYRLRNLGETPQSGALVLALRPVQINPYWQHGGHAAIHALDYADRRLSVNGETYAAFSAEPASVALADFDGGDVLRLIDAGPIATDTSLRSGSGLLSAALEFNWNLAPGESTAVVAALPMRADAEAVADVDFAATHADTCRAWREILGPRRISVGDPEVSDTVEAQIGLILVNATRYAFKPGPRNYARTWVRDGSSQAVALLWAGVTEEAKRYALWYAERIYPNGMVPPILNPDGSVNRGMGSDIEYDAQGQFVGLAAAVYRITRDRAFLDAIYEPVLRATHFIDELCARTNAQHGPDTRFHGLLAQSISHEGYSSPAYSYWDDYFALAAFRDCAFLAREVGDAEAVAYAETRGAEFATNLSRSLRLTAEADGKGMIPSSADRQDVDPTGTAITFEPCRVSDVLPPELLTPTYDFYARHLDDIRAPGFKGGFTPYEIRNVNAFIGLGRDAEAFRLLADSLGWRRPPGWRGWAEVVWGEPRAADYIGDMPHTWIGAEFSTTVRRMLAREDGDTLELLRAVPDAWWAGDGITLRELPTAFGALNLRAVREGSRVTLDLGLAGPEPARVVVRYPGARRAWADGVACPVEGELIVGPLFRRLEIEG